jgi:lambda repressor-like predicted transcriptional regulator
VVDEKRHAWIKGALALRGETLSSIARELGVTPGTVSIVSRGYRRSRRIERAIADALDSSPADLWPSRYSGLKNEKGDEK